MVIFGFAILYYLLVLTRPSVFSELYLREYLVWAAAATRFIWCPFGPLVLEQSWPARHKVQSINHSFLNVTLRTYLGELLGCAKNCDIKYFNENVRGTRLRQRRARVLNVAHYPTCIIWNIVSFNVVSEVLAANYLVWSIMPPSPSSSKSNSSILSPEEAPSIRQYPRNHT